MKFDDDKINSLSHTIAEALADDSRVEFKDVFNNIRLSIRKTIGKAIQRDDEVERYVSMKIRKIKRQVVEGTEEWNALHHKYYEEEISKLRNVR